MAKFTLEDEPFPESRKGPTCFVGMLLKDLDEQGQAVLNKWLADESITAASIARKLNSVIPDCKVRQPTLMRHRRGDCVCSR